MELEKLNIYKMSLELGERIWIIVIEWDYFSKTTIGKQLVNSIDSISANISEGYGRFSYKDSQKFYYYARGSLFESKTGARTSPGF
ncbi:four helix bundle protein, partial [Bacteroidota bacterium]